MIIARLIDAEGVSLGERAFPDDPDRPREYIVVAYSQPVRWDEVDPAHPTAMAPRYVEYRLERRDGGGTFIYRRSSPLWAAPESEPVRCPTCDAGGPARRRSAEDLSLCPDDWHARHPRRSQKAD